MPNAAQIAAYNRKRETDPRPFAEAGRWLRRSLLQYQLDHDLQFATTHAIATFLGVQNPQVHDYLDGRHAPKPTRCRFIAAQLGLDETMVLAQWGYKNTKSPPTVETLITYVLTNPRNWEIEQVNRLVELLRLAQRSDNPHDVAVVEELLGTTTWKMMDIAVRLGQWMQVSIQARQSNDFLFAQAG